MLIESAIRFGRIYAYFAEWFRCEHYFFFVNLSLWVVSYIFYRVGRTCVHSSLNGFMALWLITVCARRRSTLLQVGLEIEWVKFMFWMSSTLRHRHENCYKVIHSQVGMKEINLIVPVMSIDTCEFLFFGFLATFRLLNSGLSAAKTVYVNLCKTHSFFEFNWRFLFESMRPASMPARCQAIEWMPHSNRPQSTPTYCCQCVVSILADILR